MQVEPDEEGKVMLEIGDLSYRKPTEDIYMIEINPPGNCHIYIKKPYPPGMKLIKRDKQDYIKWRPKVRDIGLHFITVVFEGEQISEQQITIYVFNKELLEAERKGRLDAD
ncbi:MAG: hypothetical protein A2Z38_06065 [Planctomycetes bacterium RBG_19FT_COMBO_48_8]|nr:MAG: hypothetical protein A2Z38_06065 [Planctomycetes bacterium RBG_19FT_COMBO_48_8]